MIKYFASNKLSNLQNLLNLLITISLYNVLDGPFITHHNLFIIFHILIIWIENFQVFTCKFIFHKEANLFLK
jgi:hypothetical protein